MKTAIIMAAGFGSRLMPITKEVPKTMVKVNGEMMIKNILDQIYEARFERVIVVTGYLDKIIRSFLSNNYPKVEIIENKDYETTNNLYSFLLAAKEAEGDVLFMNSDLYFDKGFIKKVVGGDYSTIAVREGEWNDENMKVIVNSEFEATGISKLFTEEGSFAVSCDTYFFKEDRFKKFVEISKEVSEEDSNAWTEVAIDAMISKEPIKTTNTINYDWFEIDNLEDLKTASIIFSGNKNIFSEYDTYIYDLDGTLYTNGTPIKGAAKVINKQVEAGKNVFVITNNSAKTASDYHSKLVNLGFNVDPKNVINSTIPTIDYISRNDLTPTYVFGTSALKQKVSETVEITNNSGIAKSFLVGNNNEFDYGELTELLVGIQSNSSAKIIATNPDLLYPLGDDKYTVDTGTVINIIKSVSSRNVKVIGKPSPEIIKQFIKGKTILFGDRIYTDMLCAKNAGIESCLVMSGESNIVDYEKTDLKISRVIDSVNEQ